MKAIRYLSWALRAVLFLLLLLFALKNTDPVTLRFFFSESWQLPLVLLLLIFFAFGAVLGVVACTSRLLREPTEEQIRSQLGTALTHLALAGLKLSEVRALVETELNRLFKEGD